MNWIAVSLVSQGKMLKNKWVCRGCDQNCSLLLGLNYEPQKTDCKNYGGGT